MSLTAPAEPKQQFDLLYASLCAVQRSLLDNVAKVAGLLLLAVGWLAASKDAREFLVNNAAIRQFAMASVVVVFILAAGASWKAYRIRLRRT